MILEHPASRTAGLARVGDLTGALLSMEDTLGLRAAQAGASWAEVRRWLPGMGHIRSHARATAKNHDAGQPEPKRQRGVDFGPALTALPVAAWSGSIAAGVADGRRRPDAADPAG